MAAKRNQVVDQTPRGKRRSKNPVKEVSWDDFSNDTIRSLIAFAEYADGAVRFGRSRDRGAYSIGFYVGETHFTEWIRPGDDCDLAVADLLKELYEDFTT